MDQLYVLTSRSLKRYLRDKGTIFFSLLSMMIVIVLMFFFLGDVNVSGVTDLLAQFPGRSAQEDAANAELLILAWTCAGIVSINAVTVTLAVLSYMIRDRETGTLAAIYTAPVSRLTIAASYVLAAWVCSVIMCTATLLFTEGYCVLQGMEPFSLVTHLELLGYICVNSFTYASLMYLVASLVKSEGAWGGLGTIIGTLVGFLGGIYMPIGSLSGVVAGIVKCTPVIYGTALFRDAMTQAITQQTFQGVPQAYVDGFREVMGMELTVGGHRVTTLHQLAILVLGGTIFLLAGAAVTRLSKKNDR